MWRPSRSIRRPRKKLFRRFLMPSTPCYWKNNHLQRRELFFNDLKQRWVRLLPTTIRVSFSPDAATKKVQVALSFEFLPPRQRFPRSSIKGLPKTGQSHSCSIHFFAHTLSSGHLNNHPTLTEFLDWRHLFLGLPPFHWCCTFFFTCSASRSKYLCTLNHPQDFSK